MSFFEEKSSFSGLIRYYARKLHDPHAEGELWSFLWIAMHTHPNKPDKYYAVCLRNEYIRLSKEESAIFSLSEDWRGCCYDCCCNGIFDFVCNLTNIQTEVLKLHYICGFSISEIAEKMNISRQAVNQCKTRGLIKLSKMFLDSAKLCC